MLQLKSLQNQLETLRAVYDEAIKEGKSSEELMGIDLQIKKIERLIYERKNLLKR